MERVEFRKYVLVLRRELVETEASVLEIKLLLGGFAWFTPKNMFYYRTLILKKDKFIPKHVPWKNQKVTLGYGIEEAQSL